MPSPLGGALNEARPKAGPDGGGAALSSAVLIDAGKVARSLGSIPARPHCSRPVPVPTPICAERERSLSLKQMPRRSPKRNAGGYIGTSFLAGGYTAKALETTTPLRYIAGGFRGMTLAGTSFTSLETAVIAGTTGAVNYLLVGGAFEAGVGLSSLGGAGGDELADFIFGCPP